MASLRVGKSQQALLEFTDHLPEREEPGAVLADQFDEPGLAEALLEAAEAAVDADLPLDLVEAEPAGAPLAGLQLAGRQEAVGG
jgi:hypothetical protein